MGKYLLYPGGRRAGRVPAHRPRGLIIGQCPTRLPTGTILYSSLALSPDGSFLIGYGLPVGSVKAEAHPTCVALIKLLEVEHSGTITISYCFYLLIFTPFLCKYTYNMK